MNQTFCSNSFYTFTKVLNTICTDELIRLNQVILEYELALSKSINPPETDTELGDYILVKVFKALKRLEGNLNLLYEKLKETNQQLISLQERNELKDVIKTAYESLTTFSSERLNSYKTSPAIKNALKPCYQALIRLHRFYEHHIREEVLKTDDLVLLYYRQVREYVNIYQVKQNKIKQKNADVLLKLILEKEQDYERIIDENEKTGEYTPIFGDNHTRKSAPKRWGKWLQLYRKRIEKDTLKIRYFYLGNLLVIALLLGYIILSITLFDLYTQLNKLIMPLFK